MPTSRVTIKPWGFYEDCYRTDNVVFKKICIAAGEEISYQVHSKRDELWFVWSGTGEFTLNGAVVDVVRGSHISIYAGDHHKIRNTGLNDLVIFEMQVGFCDENDIIRLDDKYKR